MVSKWLSDTQAGKLEQKVYGWNKLNSKDTLLSKCFYGTMYVASFGH